MTCEGFQAEVTKAIAAVQAAASGALTDMPDVNYSISACDCAAEITGSDKTLCRMFNRKFREDAAALMFERNT